MSLNTYVTLPAPAANGSGAAVDVSMLAGAKTVSVEGNGSSTEPFVLIEVSNDPSALVWSPITQFQTAGERTVTVACHWMRATVSNYKGGGAPTVSAGAETSAAAFATLVAPTMDGSGAATDVSALGALKTVQVSAGFRGTVIVEVSEDGGSTWSQALSFAAGGIQTAVLSAAFMRVTRTGIPDVSGATPLLYVGGLPFSGDGGSSIAIAAGTQTATSGTILFSNDHNVSFGMNASSVVTASVNAVGNAITAIAGGTSTGTGPLIVFGNANNVSFGVNGNTVTASVIPDVGIGLAAGTQTMATGTVTLADANGVSFGLDNSSLTASVAALKTVSAGTTNASGPTIVYGDANGLSWGLNGNTLTGSVAAQSAQPGIQSVSAGTTKITTGQVVFGDANGLSWGANGQTITGSFQAIRAVSGGTTNATGSGLSFGNANNVSWGVNGNTVTASASFPAQTVQPGIQSVSAGTTKVTTGQLVFGNANGISFGANGQTITGSYTQSTGPSAISAGTTLITSGVVQFGNANGVSFGANGQVVTASVAAQSAQPGIQSVSAGTTRVTTGELVFGNANGVSFGANGQTITGSVAAQSAQPGIQSISAGTTKITTGQVVFGDGNGITWGANGQTITASVAAGGGVAIAAGTQTATASTVVFSNGQGISFGLSGSTKVTASIGVVTRLSVWDMNSPVAYTTILLATSTNDPITATVGPMGALIRKTNGATWQNFVFQRASIPAAIDATRIQLALGNSATSVNINATFTAGLYTMSASTAAVASSVTGTALLGGMNEFSFSVNTWAVTPGEYLFVVAAKAGNDIYLGGAFGSQSANSAFFENGMISYLSSASTATTQFQLSQITAANGGAPFLRLAGTF